MLSPAEIKRVRLKNIERACKKAGLSYEELIAWDPIGKPRTSRKKSDRVKETPVVEAMICEATNASTHKRCTAPAKKIVKGKHVCGRHGR